MRRASADTVGVPQLVQPSVGGVVESVNYQNLNGVETLFYAAAINNQGNTYVYESQLVGGNWVAQQLTATAGVSFSSEVSIGGATYIGFVNGSTDSLSILSNSTGSWQSVFNETVPPGDANYGGRLDLTSQDGRVVAVYTGPSAASSGVSQYLDVLDQTTNGSWSENSVPIPNNTGIIRLSPTEVAGNLDVLVGTSGGGSNFLAQRAGGPGGAWTFQTFPYSDDSGGSLVEVGSQADFFATTYSGGYQLPYYNYVQNGSRVSLSLSGGTSTIVGSDQGLINGTPTMAYLDRSNLSLHFGQFTNGVFSNQIVDTNVAADWGTAVDVFQALDGNPAVAYYNDGGSATQLKVVELPEPSAVSAIGAAVAAFQLVRRRRAIVFGCQFCRRGVENH